MFDQFIRFGARQRPWAPAVSNGHAHVTYWEMDVAVDKVGTALVAAGLATPGAVVGIAVADHHRHALLVLACARVGLGSASLFAGGAGHAAKLAGTDALIVDREGVDGATLVADEGWFDRTLAAAHAPLPVVPVDGDAIARVQLSSGTTGTPKAVELSWDVERNRLGTVAVAHGMATRFVSMIGLESGVLVSWLAVWRALGCVQIAPPEPARLARLLPVLQPTTLLASPAQIGALLDALPPGFAPGFTQMIVTVAGARLSRPLREALAIRMGAGVNTLYASTEAGTVATALGVHPADERDVGWPMPGIALEIVDADDRVLPAGETGLLRVAGAGVARRYRDGPGAAFRDGWFYPGDLGALLPDGQLRIAGRADEVLNIGGEKVSPETLEALVRPVPGIADVAAFGVPGDAGDQPWLAIVRGGEVDETAVARALTLPGLGTVRLAWIEAIPRTATGKVRRDELATAARRL